MNKHRLLLATVALAGVTALLIEPTAYAASIQFTVGGSTQMYSLGNLMGQKYQQTNNSINISVLPSTSQRGFDDTCSGSTAVGMSDIYIQDNQLLETGCSDMIAIPVAVSAVPVVYNLPGAPFNQRQSDGFTLVHPVRFTAQVMADIYMGKVKKWNDPEIQKLNPSLKLPSQVIRAYNSAEPGGSGFVFDQWLAYSVPSWNAQVGVSLSPSWPTSGSTGTQSAGDMVQNIQSTPYSIGFVGFDFAISNTLQTAALRNASGVFLTPSLNGLSKAIGDQLRTAGMPTDFRRSFVTVKGADAFNPADFEFFLVHRNLKAQAKDAFKHTAIKNFLEWAIALKGGQQFIESIALRRVGGVNKLEHGFVPVPPEIQQTARKAVDSITI